MTTIPSVFAHIGVDDKQRVQCNLPTIVYEHLFLKLLPRRGTQDRILALFLRHMYLNTKDWDTTDPKESEAAVLRLLAPIINNHSLTLNHETS